MKKLLPIFLLFAACNPARNLERIPDWPGITVVRSTFLVTHKSPSFAHSINGFCLMDNGRCIGHLDSDGLLFKLPYRVWDCETERKRRAKQ